MTKFISILINETPKFIERKQKSSKMHILLVYWPKITNVHSNSWIQTTYAIPYYSISLFLLSSAFTQQWTNQQDRFLGVYFYFALNRNNEGEKLQQQQQKCNEIISPNRISCIICVKIYIYNHLIRILV